MTTATETEKAFCSGLHQHMPTRSRSDTETTQEEVGNLRDWGNKVCPR